jgi:hypothetical protein
MSSENKKSEYGTPSPYPQLKYCLRSCTLVTSADSVFYHFPGSCRIEERLLIYRSLLVK